MRSGARTSRQALLGEGIRSDEDALRGHLYRLLGRLLAAAPDADLLVLLASLEGDQSELGRAIANLARVARTTAPDSARDEYEALFIGVGRGELVPYGSFYLTGFLNEKPLARLRVELERLGIARSAGTAEPEDHAAFLCEVMAGLIAGEFGDGSLVQQQAFFDRHLAPWAGRFFADLERAQASRLYAPLGTIGRLFMQIEETAFAMAA